MSERSSLKGKTAITGAQNDNGKSSGMAPEGPSEHLEDPEAAPITESSTTSFISFPATSLDEGSEQPAIVPVEPPRDLLRRAPDVTHPVRQRRKRKHRSVFGLSHEIGLDGRDAYEQKYARDRYGEETSENARIWLTYLDEAEPFDRERVEEWKGAADVLLVFAGLFSSVITTFIIQALQGLQRDNTQVSASLLFEIAGILRAQSNGIPLNMIPNSTTLTPTSPFIPSTNALLVNGLWFTSLAITLSTALFAVIAKQWPRYSLSSIPGTANERARARQLRFKGFEVWKVGTILDLLPVLLYLAVGLFLTGIIIMLFPLNAAIAWTIFSITGIAYTLYFISVILPIQYPECPYTTSMTIYVGVLFFVLRNALCRIGAILNQGLHVVWRKVNPEICRAIRASAYYAIGFFRHGFMFISRLANVIRRGFRRLLGKFPEFAKWREEKIKQAIQTATFLDSEALSWLYVISWNRSVHRMIARCAAVNPVISGGFVTDILENLNRDLEISEANVVDLRYGLCLDLLTKKRGHWDLLQSISNAEESQLEEEEYQTYLRIADTVLQRQERQTLYNAINGNYRLPLAMWDYLLENASTDPTVARHILIRGLNGLFNWAFDPTRQRIPDTGLVHFDSKELGWWKFEHLFHYFNLGNPDYSSEAKIYETYYLLLVAIYRNLTGTSRRPIITHKEQRRMSLEEVFYSFSERLHRIYLLRPLEYALRLFTEVCCVDSFWCESMADNTKSYAVWFLRTMVPLPLVDIQLDDHLPFIDGHGLSLIYQWYSRDLDPELSYHAPPLFMLLLMSQNRHHLSTILLNDTNAVPNFSKCIYNLVNCHAINKETRIYPILIELLKSVGLKKNLLFAILYNPSVLLQLWKLLVLSDCNTKGYFLLLKSEIDRDELDELFAAMDELAQSDDFPYVYHWQYERDTVRSALTTSARAFGQFIGVSHIQLEATADRSAPGDAASNNDHDNEERAQVPGLDERRTFNFIGNWMKKVFESIWLKIPRQISDQSTASSSLPLSEMDPTPIAQ